MNNNLFLAPVFCPQDIAINRYIEYCNVSYTISVLPYGGTIISNVYCSQDILNSILFPSQSGMSGATVLCAHVEGGVVAVNVLPTYNIENNYIPNKKIIRQQYKNFFVDIVIDPLQPSICLSVEGDSPKIDISSSGGDLSVSAKSITIDCSKFTLRAEDVIDIEGAGNSIGMRNNIVQVDTASFTINEGDSASVLGSALEVFLNELVDECSNIKVNTPQGLMPINAKNMERFLALKKKIEELYSQVVSIE